MPPQAVFRLLPAWLLAKPAIAATMDPAKTNNNNNNSGRWRPRHFFSQSSPPGNNFRLNCSKIVARLGTQPAVHEDRNSTEPGAAATHRGRVLSRNVASLGGGWRGEASKRNVFSPTARYAAQIPCGDAGDRDASEEVRLGSCVTKQE
ncbi:hypothetical protein CPLU01_12778 [Colletotrichum plurivorum]|uniref:Secreted protein n=1 Tax=Colletotrichum plurivorum TaxID=2175906 RepID=A0A8H6JVU4_9PEZI|nr:hypothetical protein CPLU01_12778 [Colletotrichum plurivorum]